MGRKLFFACVSGVLALSLSANASMFYHGPYAHYGVEVLSGPVSSIGANGDRTDFNDDGNHLELSTPGGTATLTRDYVVKVTPDAGWEFTSLSLMALGQGSATTGTFRAGPLNYSIGATSGQLENAHGGYYAQNPVWDFFSEFYFGAYDLPVPASGFTVTFSTTIYTGIYSGGGTAGLAFMGDSRGPYTFAFGANLQQSVPEPASAMVLLGSAALLTCRRGRR